MQMISNLVIFISKEERLEWKVVNEQILGGGSYQGTSYKIKHL